MIVVDDDIMISLLLAVESLTLDFICANVTPTGLIRVFEVPIKNTFQ